MQDVLKNLKISVTESIYIKDPESSNLGKRIVEDGILLVDEVGFDNFTFKKLGERIGSNESSIYRYFENKHKFLLYLTCWYWGWKEYQLVLATHSIEQPETKLIMAIQVITQPVKEDSAFRHIDEVALNNIIVNESSKSYLTKEVDKENKEGYFSVYKRLATKLKDMIAAFNPEYPYPASLSSSVLEGSLHQHFLKEHFISITDCSAKISPTEYYTHLVLNLLKS